jgi:hypothetical protein
MKGCKARRGPWWASVGNGKRYNIFISEKRSNTNCLLLWIMHI